MKKVLSFVLIFFCIFVLSGCNNKIDNNNITKPELKDIPEFNTSDKINVDFWHARGQTSYDPIQQIINEFNIYYPNIQVTQTSMGDFTTLREIVISSIESDKLPTIVQTSASDTALYLTYDIVQELESYVQSNNSILLVNDSEQIVGLKEQELNNYIDGFMEECRSFDSFGTLYSLPFTKSTEVLFYNKTIFDKYGYSVPQTWDDILAICEDYVTRPEYQNLVKEGKNTAVFSIDSQANLFITLTQQWGGEYTKFDASGKGVYAFDNSQSKAAMVFFKENFDKGYFASATHFGADYSSEPFKAQQCIMTIGSSAGASYNVPYDKSFEVGVTTYPQKDMNNPQVVQQGTNVSLFKCTNPQEELAGWLFMKFLTNYESSLEIATETAYMPIRKDVINSKEYLDHISGIYNDQNIMQKTEMITITQSSWLHSYPSFDGMSNGRDAASSIVSSILYGGKTVKEAYQDAMDSLYS